MTKSMMVLLMVLPFTTLAHAENCGTVVVDCEAKKITLPGLQERSHCGRADAIDCGYSTVNTPLDKDGDPIPGEIGGGHNTRKVPHGIEILNILGMGNSGGGKVFHTPNPYNLASCPKGKTWGLGCISITSEALKRLQECKGSKLVIKNAHGHYNTIVAHNNATRRVVRYAARRNRYYQANEGWSYYNGSSR